MARKLFAMAISGWVLTRETFNAKEAGVCMVIDGMGDSLFRSSGKSTAFEVPKSLSQSIESYIERQIISGQLRSGLRLVPEDIAMQMKVSKSPVREALLRLQREGLITYTPRVGFFVADIDIEDIEEIYPIRAALNVLRIRLAMEKEYEKGFIEKLEEIVSDMERRAKNSEIIEYFYLNLKFYNCLSDQCQNHRLKTIIDQLGKEVLRFQRKSLTEESRLKGSLQWHQKLLHALQERDIEEASMISEKMVYDGLKALRVLLGK